jgi:hypothetical protein
MKNILFLFSSIILISTSIFSQKKEVRLYYSPQYLFVNAVKLDIEFALDSNNSKSLLLTPYIQMGMTNTSNGAFEKSYQYQFYSYPDSEIMLSDNLLGLGLGISQKIYLIDGLEANSIHSPYFHYGVSYLYSKVSYEYFEKGKKDEFSGKYSYGERKNAEDKFNILNVQTTMGDRIKFGQVFNLDLYAGIGLKYSDVSTTAKGYRNYSRSVFDYAFTGIHPVVGARLGFDLR